MRKSGNSISAIEGVREKLQQTQTSGTQATLDPGDKVVVLDVFGVPTGIYCKVKRAEKHQVEVTWNGGGGITVGRSWLRKVS